MFDARARTRALTSCMVDANLNGHKLNAATKYYGCNVNDSADKSFRTHFSLFVSRRWRRRRRVVASCRGSKLFKKSQNEMKKTVLAPKNGRKKRDREGGKGEWNIGIHNLHIPFCRASGQLLGASHMRSNWCFTNMNWMCGDVVCAKVVWPYHIQFLFRAENCICWCPFRHTHSNDIWP